MIIDDSIKNKFYHLNKVIINKSALSFNHKALQAFHPEAKIIPVLKSNAYGHGLMEVASILDGLKPEFLVVNNLSEAFELAKLKVNSPILVLGHNHPGNFSVKCASFHITIFDLEVAKRLNSFKKLCKIHIFVDTGMCREGVSLSNLAKFTRALKELCNLSIVGLASHFADADNSNNDFFTKKQLVSYNNALRILKSEGIIPQFRHISASGGAFKIKNKTFNLVRGGLASYGINPLETNDLAHNTISLKPALSLVSTLVQIKYISKGYRVGYNGTFVAKKGIKIGLLPLGYFEGLDRRLSNKGMVSIRGKMSRILGRVSMNMTTIDLSAVDNPKVGDLVTIYSNYLNDDNSINNAAKVAGTIPYDLLVHINESVKRVVN